MIVLRDIQIFVQVILKEWIVLNKKMPADDKDWEEVRRLAKNLWKNTEMTFKELNDAINEQIKNRPPFESSGAAKPAKDPMGFQKRSFEEDNGQPWPDKTPKVKRI